MGRLRLLLHFLPLYHLLAQLHCLHPFLFGLVDSRLKSSLLLFKGCLLFHLALPLLLTKFFLFVSFLTLVGQKIFVDSLFGCLFSNFLIILVVL